MFYLVMIDESTGVAVLSTSEVGICARCIPAMKSVKTACIKIVDRNC